MIKKYLIMLGAAAGLTVLVLAFSWLGVVFGWTNPTQAPPSGSGLITVLNGNLGINTTNPTSRLSVNGVVDVLNNLIKNVATPIAGTDAATKAYVDAQVSNDPSGAFIIYGRASVTGLIQTNPGDGVPACPNGYGDLLYSPHPSNPSGPTYAGGYGPLGTVVSYGQGNTDEPIPDPDEPNFQANTSLAIGTYSLCSSVDLHVVPGHFKIGTTFYSTAAKACVVTGAQGNEVTICNTCRVCGKTIPPLGP